MALLEWLHSFDNIDLAISDKGHSFMNLMVAFLIVSRVNISVSRYNEARGNLEVMYREARELMQNACILSNHLTDTTAKEWRLLIAYRCMCLLRLSMAVIDYQETRIPVWEIDELAPEEKKALKATLFYNTDSSSPNAMRWAHEVRNEEEENMRVPVRMAYELRKAIHKQRQLFDDKKLETSQENKLLGSVDSYMSGYYGIRKFLTTPFPFPLVQMARTFLFFYVYTVPFALLSDPSIAIVHCIEIFVLTYGFMGLETVSIELDNPFGDDDNDFDNLGMAYTAFEDNYVMISDIDGPEYTDKLRAKMFCKKEGDNISTEQTWLLKSNLV
jgi:predicted membrane chloride channel (bestrophin family)